MKVEMTNSFMKDLKNILRPNLFRKFKDCKFDKRMRKQRYKRGYSDSDCWNLHYWLTETFPKMIYNLRDRKHGAPEYEFEEFETLPLEWINKYAQIYTDQIEKNSLKGKDYDYTDTICFWGGTISDRCFCRWWIILTRIAWCLEQASADLDVYNEYREEYEKQLWGDKDNIKFSDLLEVASYDKNGNPEAYTLKQKEIDEELKQKYYDKEKEIQEEKDQYKNEAFDLIKKYFYNLWD